MSMYVPNDKIQQMMNILPEYMKIKGYTCSRGHMMHCIHPDHEDVHPSMGIFQGRDGKMRLHCFGCGRTFDIFDAVEILDHVKGIPQQYSYLCKLFDKENIEITVVSNNVLQDYVKQCALYKTSYWKKRGIADNVVAQYRLGYDPQRDCVVIPVGQACIRRYLHKKHPDRYRKSKGFAGYLNIENVNNSLPIIICEGEIDTLSIISSGYMNVVSAGGAANVAALVTSWHYAGNLRLVEALDLDDTGRNQADKLKAICQMNGYDYKSLWKYMVPMSVKDINDVWVSAPNELKKAITAITDRGESRVD